MKKDFLLCIKFTVGLLLVLTIIDFLLTYGLKSNYNGYYGKLNKICKAEKLPQVAIFSSSVGEMGFDCKVLEKLTNKSWYNFSLTGTTYKQYAGLIDEICKKNSVEVVVLGEVIFTFQENGAINEIERYLPYISNSNIYKSLYDVQPDLTFKSRYIPFYKYIAVSKNYYLQSLVGLKGVLLNRKNNDTLLGQIRVNRKWEADQDSIWEHASHIDVPIDTGILHQYQNGIKNLVTNGKKVIIIIPPFYLPKEQTIIDITEFRNTLKQNADDKNVFFFDFSESMVDKKYFYNVLHLNSYGASVFSRMLADTLKSKKIVL